MAQRHSTSAAKLAANNITLEETTGEAVAAHKWHCSQRCSEHTVHSSGAAGARMGPTQRDQTHSLALTQADRVLTLTNENFGLRTGQSPVLRAKFSLVIV